jgi:hypothetical protein
MGSTRFRDPHPGRSAIRLSPPDNNFKCSDRHLRWPVGRRQRRPSRQRHADAAGGTGAYTVNSAGYNIWYNRDEFRFLWKKLSGDASLAADVTFPNPKGYDDRKAVLIIRQSLDDDSKEALAGLHGRGLLHGRIHRAESRKRRKV